LQSQNEKIELQNNELAKINTTKDRLFSIISHDLKTPFHVISGFVSVLLTNFYDYTDVQKKEILHLIENSSSSAFEMLHNLLFWSRSNLNSINFKPVSFNINEVTSEICTFFKLILINKNLKLSSDNQEISVFADKDLTNTIIRNLIANAIKFTPTGGVISLNYSIEKDYLIFTVNDTGIGMSPEVIKKVFFSNEGYSAQGTEGETGTGIGLMLCRDFVERNGGKMIVTSIEGKGSSIGFTLPLSKSVKTIC